MLYQLTTDLSQEKRIARYSMGCFYRIIALVKINEATYRYRRGIGRVSSVDQVWESFSIDGPAMS